MSQGVSTDASEIPCQDRLTGFSQRTAPVENAYIDYFPPAHVIDVLSPDGAGVVVCCRDELEVDGEIQHWDEHRREDERALADSFFRDRHCDQDGQHTVVHEWSIRAKIDPSARRAGRVALTSSAPRAGAKCRRRRP